MNKRAIIIDDERLARNELKKLLTEFPEIVLMKHRMQMKVAKIGAM
jgi:hypothetical protein